MGFLRKLVRARPPVPQSAKRHLEKEERALAWAEAVTGQIVVATDRGLHIVGSSAHRRVGWHEISKATWEGRELRVIESREVDDYEIVDRRPWTLAFDEPGTVPVVLRERVQSSVVVSVFRDLSAGGVRIVGRKEPGVDGLRWQFRADPGADFSGHADRAEVLAELQAERDKHTPSDL